MERGSPVACWIKNGLAEEGTEIQVLWKEAIKLRKAEKDAAKKLLEVASLSQTADGDRSHNFSGIRASASTYFCQAPLSLRERISFDFEF